MGECVGIRSLASGEWIERHGRRTGWDETGNGSGDVMKRLVCEEEFENSHMVMHSKRLY